MSRFDQQTYNASAETGFDNDEFKPTANHDDEPVQIAPRGGDNQPTSLDASREDAEAGRSEVSGQVSQREAQGLLSELRDDERNVRGKTRTNKVDAYQQERAVDGQVDDALNRPNARNDKY